MFRALSHRNFRLFWIGAFLSNVGTWMQAVAQGWLVLTLTNSPFWLGLDAFVATAPGFFLTLIGGVFADLIDRRRFLLYTQVAAGIAALGLAILVATGVVNRWMVLGFSFVTGCCMALLLDQRWPVLRFASSGSQVVFSRMRFRLFSWWPR